MYFITYLLLGLLAVYYLYEGKYEIMKWFFFFDAEPDEELTETDFTVSYFSGALIVMFLWPIIITIAYFE